MVKQREGYRFVIKEDAQKRIDAQECPACGKPKEEWTRRKDWTCCSPECTQKYLKESTFFGWGDLRSTAFERDGWRCVKCGKQPLIEKIPLGWYHSNLDMFIEHYRQKRLFKYFENKKSGMVAWVIDTSQLIGDHLIPIALGGDEWSLDNVQTLCLECNKVKTKEDMGKIAILRRKEKMWQKGQKFL